MTEIKINTIHGDLEFTNQNVKDMYEHLVALYHRSSTNGLVSIDSYDRQQLKVLLKLPANNYND